MHHIHIFSYDKVQKVLCWKNIVVFLPLIHFHSHNCFVIKQWMKWGGTLLLVGLAGEHRDSNMLNGKAKTRVVKKKRVNKILSWWLAIGSSILTESQSSIRQTIIAFLCSQWKKLQHNNSIISIAARKLHHCYMQPDYNSLHILWKRM